MSKFARVLTLALLLLVACGEQSQQAQAPPITPIPETPFTPVQVPLYSFTDLGVLEGYAESEARGINDWGQVVGSSWRGRDKQSLPLQEAFLWENGQMLALGALEDYSRAAAINNLGQIVGEGDNPSFHSFFWAGGASEVRDLQLNNGNESTAYDINDRGQVVGFNFKRDFPQAYIWEADRVIELAEEFGESYANAINNAGRVVGKRWPLTGTTDDGFAVGSDPRAFLWDHGTIRDLGIFGRASDINEKGQIVGDSHAQGSSLPSAFLWQEGTVTELGHLGGEESMAEAINDAGQVVGASRNRANKLLATLWERGRIRDLNQLAETGDAHLQWAYDINNRAQIVGRALRGEAEHGFLLTPQWAGSITRGSSFLTAMELGERLIFDYWADILPDSGPTSPFTIEIMVLDGAGIWSLLGKVEEQAASAAWKTALVQVPANLIGTSKELSLQISGYHVAADPIIFMKSFRTNP